MRFRILGPLRVRNGAEWSSIRAAQQRVVLSVLLIESGQVVATDRLIDELWPDQPPRAAGAVIRGYVMRLRRTVGGGTDGPLVTGNAGYRLDVDADEFDGGRFNLLVEAGRRALAEDDPELAATRLSEALALWRGPALADVPASPTIAAEVTRLEQARLAATEDHVGAKLALGHHRDVVADLQRLVEKHPLRERFWTQLMLALYRCDRRGEALELYQRARTVLATELGLEPGPQLRELQRTILSGDDSLVPGRPRSNGLAPNCLPADHPGFTGRRGDLEDLATLLDPERASTTTPLILVTGSAGVGKTTLAVHWAHQVAARFPDGQLFVNLRGFDPTGSMTSPGEAIRVLLDALQVPPQRIPASLDAQIGRYRSLLAGRRVLIVLDNARDSGQARPLLPGTPGSLVLVTSRNQLTGLIAADGAHPVRLDVLPAAEGRLLLERRLGAERLAAEPAATDEIVDRCAGLPLALAIVAARAATRPRFALQALAHELSTGLDGFTGDDDATDVRAVLSWSYQSLKPEVARLFRLLATHPGPDLATPAAASLAGLPPRRVRPLLAELTRAHLVDEPTPGRYAFHDLLRAYAAELTEETDSGVERHAALHRMLDHYAHTAHAGAPLLEPDRDPITVPPPQPGVTPEHLADQRQALAWFTAEHRVLTRAAARAANAGFDRHAWHLPWTLASFLDLRGHWLDQIAVQTVARDAAVRLGDRRPQIRAVNSLARAYVRLGRLGDAHTHFQQAAVLSNGLGDDPLRAHTRINLGSLLASQGRYREALPIYQQALELYEAARHQGGQVRTLNSIGWCHAKLGDHHRALAHCQHALTLALESGDRSHQGHVWDSIGFAHDGLGDHRRAAACYERAIALHREASHRYVEAGTLTRLGDSHRAMGALDAAHVAWWQALTILEELDHPDADRIRRKLQPVDA
nr:BTAD domain-containing putative transcriptional regulator [Micromonospora sp. DSM 115978]